MRAHTASDTAALTAMLRAAHQLIDDEPKVVDDPIAVRLVESAAPGRIAAQRSALLSPRLMVPRAAVVLRSRYAEDLLAEAVARGVGQFVILGAGLDTFAYRQPAFAHALQIFEVDHPATQAWKRQGLAAAGIEIPNNLHWAPIDFERQTLAAGLQEAGFNASRPAFFSWLGVIQYLTLPAIDGTLEMVAGLPPPSTIILSFMLPDADLPAEEAAAARAVAEDAAKKGEPWLTRISPTKLAGRLTKLGFHKVVHLTPEEANARYFDGRRDGLHAPRVAQLISAST
ncbi:MAG: class I SAM-dependent methyltransferase [Alphaproteobacteria bacterium]|nr:class I SAM-dependent methyltransferase [Alphaproteobacteria bacterium]